MKKGDTKGYAWEKGDTKIMCDKGRESGNRLRLRVIREIEKHRDSVCACES